MIGLEKMIKVLLWNYLLMSLTLATNQSIILFTDFLKSTPNEVFASFSYASIAQFFTNGRMTIVLILYLLLLFLVYSKSKIRLILPSDDIVQKILMVTLVPLTVLGVIFSLIIVFMGTSLFDPGALQILILKFPPDPLFSTFISYIPVWIFVHALITILVTSEIRFQIKTGI